MLLSVDTLLNGADLRVCITPQWNDDCLIHHSSQHGPTLETKKYDKSGWSLALANDNTVDMSQSVNDDGANAQDQLDISLPERCNLRLHVAGDGFCSVDVCNKLEGDVDINLDHGDICVNKIRGPNVNFHSGRGRVQVNAVAEGALSVRASEFQAKTLQGPSIDLEVDGDIDVRAAYGGEIRASSSTGSVLLGTVHAPTLRCSAPGRVRVDALKGDADLSSSDGDISAHFDAQGPNGRSTVVADKGDVDLSVQLFATVAIDFSAREISFPPPSVGSVTFEGRQQMADADSGVLCSAEGEYRAHASTDQRTGRSSGKISLEGRQAAATMAATRGSEGAHLPPAEQFRLEATAKHGRAELRIGSWVETMRRKLKLKLFES